MTSISATGTGKLPRTSQVDTLVIGAGQAGLSTARELSRLGVDCLVLEAAPRIADQWRHQYDSLRLFSSNKISHLPGKKLPGPSNGYCTKDEFADYLQSYAQGLDLPILTGAQVTSVTRTAQGFSVHSRAGNFTSRNVVVATGPHGAQPAIPACAADLDPQILQLHSSQYRRPGQLRPGSVLVVGASHSGCDIACELAATHRVQLSGRDTGEVPVPWESRRMGALTHVLAFAFRHILTRRTPLGRKTRGKMLEHGAPRLRVKKADLEAAGVRWSEQRVTGTDQGLPVLGDGTRCDVQNVIWATGFHHDYSWLQLPVLDDAGWPRECRGVSADIPGLYFCGLAFQYSMASMMLLGVGRDARYVARRIAGRPGT